MTDESSTPEVPEWFKQREQAAHSTTATTPTSSDEEASDEPSTPSTAPDSASDETPAPVQAVIPTGPFSDTRERDAFEKYGQRGLVGTPDTELSDMLAELERAAVGIEGWADYVRRVKAKIVAKTSKP